MEINRGKKLLSFTLEGKLYSKKNSQRVIKIRVGKRGDQWRPAILPSKAYCSSHPIFLAQLKEQLPEDFKTLRCPVVLTSSVFLNNEAWFEAWLKGRDYHGNIKGQDVDNKIASMGDLLKDAGVLTDDSQIVGVEVYKFPGKRLPSGEQGAQITLYEAVFS